MFVEVCSLLLRRNMCRARSKSIGDSRPVANRLRQEPQLQVASRLIAPKSPKQVQPPLCPSVLHLVSRLISQMKWWLRTSMRTSSTWRMRFSLATKLTLLTCPMQQRKETTLACRAPKPRISYLLKSLSPRQMSSTRSSTGQNFSSRNFSVRRLQRLSQQLTSNRFCCRQTLSQC